MNKTVFLFILSITGLAIMSSCTSKKDIIYFQGTENFSSPATDHKVTISKNDLLRITVTAEDMRVVQPYNFVVGQVDADQDPLLANSQQKFLSYLVDSEGFINFPQLGRLKVAGLTKLELQQLLQHKISDSVNNPIVDVRILNYRITVLGEVNNPGTFTIRDERISIPQAIGLAGDLTIYGKRDNILLIRSEGDSRSTYRIDLTSNEILGSDLYFLTQNDVLVVEPNSAQVSSANFNRNSQLYVSVASLLLSVIIIIVNTSR